MATGSCVKLTSKCCNVKHANFLFTKEKNWGKNIKSMNWFYWLLVFADNSHHHVVKDGLSSNFYPGYFSGCPELFKLCIVPGLLVDESKDYVFKYFPASLLSCPLLVSKNYIVNPLSAFLVPSKPTELSLVAARNIKPDMRNEEQIKLEESQLTTLKPCPWIKHFQMYMLWNCSHLH